LEIRERVVFGGLDTTAVLSDGCRGTKRFPAAALSGPRSRCGACWPVPQAGGHAWGSGASGKGCSATASCLSGEDLERSLGDLGTHPLQWERGTQARLNSFPSKKKKKGKICGLKLAKNSRSSNQAVSPK